MLVWPSGIAINSTKNNIVTRVTARVLHNFYLDEKPIGHEDNTNLLDNLKIMLQYFCVAKSHPAMINRLKFINTF